MSEDVPMFEHVSPLKRPAPKPMPEPQKDKKG